MKCLQYIDFDDMVYYFVMLVFAFLYLCDDVMNIFAVIVLLTDNQLVNFKGFPKTISLQ